MDEIKAKRGPGRPKVIRDNDEDELLNELFSNINTNFSVKVYRFDPEWCSGYLGEFLVGAGKSVSMEEIKNRFGGRKFELIVADPEGKIIRKKSIMIDDAPKREGEILRRDGTTEQKSKSDIQRDSEHPLDAILKMGLPAHITRQVAGYYLGNADIQGKESKDGTNDLVMQQMMMDMMQQSRQSQMQMMQQQFDMQKRMMDAMREIEDSKKVRDPMNELDTTIKLMREINGIKTELGVGSNDNLASQVLETTVPLVETALTEYLGYKRMQAQADIQKNMNTQTPAPTLPSPSISPLPQISPVEINDNPIDEAKKMGEMYKRLSPEEQKHAMNAFFSAMDDTNNDDIIPDIAEQSNPAIMDNNDTMLTDADKAILDGNNNKNESGYVSNSEYAPPANNNDQAYREGDPGGFPPLTD